MFEVDSMLISFFNCSSVIFMPVFVTTSLSTFWLFINSLYVDTNFVLTATSAAVEDVFVLFFSLFDANTKVVVEVYIGVINLVVYMYPIPINNIVINIIKNFLFQNIFNNSTKSISSIVFLLYFYM